MDAIILLAVFAYVGLGFFFGARFVRRSEEVVVALSAFGVPLLSRMPQPAPGHKSL